MRISLKVGATIYPLAGTSGVAERVHSSAGDFRITAQSEQELILLIRASTARMVDRGNLATTISFSTSRLFASPAQAFLYTLDHDAALPRAGQLWMEVETPAGAGYSRYLMDVVISPPSRRVIGCTALLEYTATGGGIVGGPGYDAPVLTIAGTFTKFGGGAFVFPALPMVGLSEGYPFYCSTGLPFTGAGTEIWVGWSLGSWGIYGVIDALGTPTLLYNAITANGTQATPDLVTSWSVLAGTGTPTLTLT